MLLDERFPCTGEDDARKQDVVDIRFVGQGGVVLHRPDTLGVDRVGQFHQVVRLWTIGRHDRQVLRDRGTYRVKVA
ncbi:hypothetical protein D3C84_916610 [compost metagenome]